MISNRNKDHDLIISCPIGGWLIYPKTNVVPGEFLTSKSGESSKHQSRFVFADFTGQHVKRQTCVR